MHNDCHDLNRLRKGCCLCTVQLSVVDQNTTGEVAYFGLSLLARTTRGGDFSRFLRSLR